MCQWILRQFAAALSPRLVDRDWDNLLADIEAAQDVWDEPQPLPENFWDGPQMFLPDVVTVGPACFAAADGSCISWNGRLYTPKDDDE